MKRARKAPASPELDNDGHKVDPSVVPAIPPASPKGAAPEDETATLKVTESSGDIFDAPAQTLIIHACNTEGSWGAGIALAFRQRYPKAFASYAGHCNDHTAEELIGTAYVIGPQSGDEGEVFVGCLFTSRLKGRKKDSPKKILEATGPAMRQLLQKVLKWNEVCGEDAEKKVEEVRMCKINSGLFNVPWDKTKAVLEALDVSGLGNWDVKVVSPP